MNLLMSVPWDQEQGGVTHVAASLAKILERRGHRVYFVFPGEAWRPRRGMSRRGFEALWYRLRDKPQSGSSLRQRISWWTMQFTTLPQLRHFNRRYHIDLINIHYPTGNFFAELAEQLDVPLVVSAHGSDLLPDSQNCADPGIRHLLAAANAVVVPSRAFLSRVLPLYSELQGKTSYIYNGYDPEEFKPMATPSPVLREQIVALTIAALIEKKGIDVLIRALANVRDQRLCVRLVGEGGLRSQLQALAVQLGVADRVTFVGSLQRSDVVREIANANFLVMPSRHESESFGLAALEGMALSKPVIASRVGGLRELVDDGVTGLSVPPDDAISLTSALETFCADPDLRRSLGEAARTKASHFTIDVTADRYEQLFRRLIG